MTIRAASYFSLEPDSVDAGKLTGDALLAQLDGEKPKLVVVYATTNHDQVPLLEGLRAAVGPETTIVGCSSQGVVGNAELTEEGLAVAAMAFGGSSLRTAAALERQFQVNSEEKGRSLATQLLEQLGSEPVVAVLLYDPLCGADVEALISGIRSKLSCPIVGGGAGQPWGPPVQTFQYWGEEVLSNGVVLFGISGPLQAEVGICHGTSPTGISMTITKAKGSHILEIDGRRALDVLFESLGYTPPADGIIPQEYLASWAIGIQRPGQGDRVATVIRGAFGFDSAAGSIIVQAAIPEGARVMFHHRKLENVLGGTEHLGRDLADRLGNRSPWAVLGFECAARTFPFLGEQNTLKEHKLLRETVAPNAPWLGMMAWGEIGPSEGLTAFHNYTYPVVVLTA
jgi:hypothetical protein